MVIILIVVIVFTVVIFEFTDVKCLKLIIKAALKTNFIAPISFKLIIIE